MRRPLETIRLGGPDTAPLFDDFYRPACRSPYPIVVAVHGGGWARGSKAELGKWAAYFARHGLATLSIDHLLSDAGASFPRNAQDVAETLAHVRDHATVLGVDAARIGLLGASSGAHLAALVATSAAFGAPDLAALVGIYGIYDLTAHWHAGLSRNDGRGAALVEQMLGTSPIADPAAYRRASPIVQIGSRALPPVMLAWGGADDVIAPEQSSRFAAALSRDQREVETLVLPGAGHFWFSRDDPDDPSSSAGEAAPALLDFLTRHLLR